MKNRIELGDFIHQVKQELVNAQRNDDKPFYTLEEVELEVSFVLGTSGRAKGSIFVVDIEGTANSTQTHKIKLRLKPIETVINNEKEESISSVKSTGGHGGGLIRNKINYR